MKAMLWVLCLVLLVGLCACGAKASVPSEETLPPNFSLTETLEASPERYENLLAWAESEEEAQEIAEAYGIPLCSYALNIATFHTDEDPREVVRRGKSQGLPELSVNGTMKPFSTP